MQSNSIILGVVAGMIALAAFLMAVCLSLFALLSLDIDSLLECVVLSSVAASLVLPWIGYILHLRSFTWRSLVWSLVLSCSPAFALLLWNTLTPYAVFH